MNKFIVCAFLILIAQTFADSCVDGNCGSENAKGAPISSNAAKALEKAPGSTPALTLSFEKPGKPVDFLPGAPGPMPAYGPEDAAVRIHWFSDFQCPVCTRAMEPLKYLARDSEHASNVRLIFVNNALSSHKRANGLAIAGLAAAKQNKFWEYVNLVTFSQNLGEALIETVSQIPGLDIDTFKADLEDPSLSAQVDYETALAANLGLTGTPAICVNGRCTKGWGSYNGVAHQVASNLKKLHAPTFVIPEDWTYPFSHLLTRDHNGDDAQVFYDAMYEGSFTSTA